jgi:16S rRNA (guanine966-N2)-methyltransferase
VSRSANQLRIIGGKWRSRRIHFVDAEGLRPTPDRVRETLFNWLQFEINGAHCLDAFAGSGALGFEALSRGAASVVLLEKQRAQLLTLQETSTTLQADTARIISGDAQALLQNPADWQPAQGFDGVFLDPPFHQSLLPDICRLLHERRLLKAGAFVYIETESEWSALGLPVNFQLQKKAHAGLVQAYLARYESEAEKS